MLMPLILLGAADMIFSVSVTTFLNLGSSSFALMAMVVNIQAAKEVPMRSVGENRSPFPWLSVGASVSITEPDCKWVAKVLNSPV
jgi:hypothetical protein